MPRPGEQHAAIPNVFATATPYTGYTPDEVAALQCRLDKQLGPEYISTREGPGGTKLSYIAADKVINLANEVFGFNGWSTSIQNVNVDFIDENTAGRVSMGCSIVVRVTLKDGTYHEDIGYGEIKNCPSKAAAFEKTKKEASTDALKRALRCFGNILGNCLYDKSYLQKVTKVRSAPVPWDADDLHRPTISASKSLSPTKKEISETKYAPEKARNNQATRAVHEDDEFGADDFDESDFTAEEVAQTMSDITGNPAQQSRPNGNHPSNAGSSLPVTTRQQIKNGNNALYHPSQVHAEPGKIPGNMRPPQELPRQQHNAQVIPNSAPGQQPAQTQGPTAQAIGTSEPVTPAVTFYRASAVAQVPGDSPVIQVDQTKKFDPSTPNHMRRTSGVDHNRSGPVLRQAVNHAQSATTPTQNTSFERPPNFVNLQADANRKIGMPSPASKKPNFRPPSNANGKRAPETYGRSALSDVSNIQDPSKNNNLPKKAKLATEPGAGAENGIRNT